MPDVGIEQLQCSRHAEDASATRNRTCIFNVPTLEFTMSDWVMPAAVARPTPRKVTTNGCFGSFFVLYGVMTTVIVFLILVIAAASAHKTSVLKHRGHEIIGHVVSEHVVEGKNNSHSYFIDYRFEPPELTHQAV